MGAPVLGIDIGGSSLRLAEARPAGPGRYALRGWHEEPVPPEALESGHIAPGPLLTAALKAAVARLKPQARQAVVGLGPPVTLVRRVTLPRVPPRRLRRLVEMQGADWIPFWREGACFDVLVTDPDAAPGQQEVLLVAVPLQLVQRLQASLRRAGLRLAGVDLDLSGLYRAALATGLAAAPHPVVLLDDTTQPARFGLWAGGVPAVVRHLQPEPGEADLAVELGRTTEVTLGRLRGAPPLGAGVAALGDAAAAGMVQQELAERLGGRLDAGFTVWTPGAAGLPVAAAAAFGLALTPALGSRVHLLPRLTYAQIRERRLLGALLATAVAGAGVFGDTQWQSVQRLESREAAVRQQLDRHRAALVGEQQALAAEARLKQHDELLRYMLQNAPWTEAYPHLTALLPAGTVLSTATGELPNLVLKGTATSPDALAAFVAGLAKSEYFQDPVVYQYAPGQVQAPGAFEIRVAMRPGKVST